MRSIGFEIARIFFICVVCLSFFVTVVVADNFIVTIIICVALIIGVAFDEWARIDQEKKRATENRQQQTS